MNEPNPMYHIPRRDEIEREADRLYDENDPALLGGLPNDRWKRNVAFHFAADLVLGSSPPFCYSHAWDYADKRLGA